MYKTGLEKSEVARQINRHKSTVSREIKRNIGLRSYRLKLMGCDEVPCVERVYQYINQDKADGGDLHQANKDVVKSPTDVVLVNG